MYEVSSGTPELISFLPDGSVGPCNASVPYYFHDRRAVSADGRFVFFVCGGDLYVRDLEAAATIFIATQGDLLKSTPTAAFFRTGQSLNPEDDGGFDVYRYDLLGGTRDCLTCGLVPGLLVSVGETVVADDGSRLYFRSPRSLLPGAPAAGIYRLDVDTGGLAYVADIGAATIGDDVQRSQAISADGAWLLFGSDHAALNPLGAGPDNHGSYQYYLYDDRRRTVTCVSCPSDGGPPLADVPVRVGPLEDHLRNTTNATPLADDGTLAFATPTPLLPADQNTPSHGSDSDVGTDIYEYRDGRLLLVTDGLTQWPGGELVPTVEGVSPSGRDIFFVNSAQLTPDALDGFGRLYDARIGGGIDFPVPLPPCPLEVCQGTPQGAPSDPFPATIGFSGAGNAGDSSSPRKCPRGKRRIRRGGRVKCVKRKRHRLAQRRGDRNRKRAGR